MRGDIGAIGDDVPSIFPIVAGVVLFIATMAYVWPQYDARNEYLELRKTALSFSYFVANKGFVSDAEFTINCPAYRDYAARHNVKFVLSLKKACKHLDITSDVFTTTTIYAGGAPPSASAAYSEGKRCTSEVTGLPKVAGQPISKTNLPRDFQMYSFPMAVQCDDANSLAGLGTLNFLVWKK